MSNIHRFQIVDMGVFRGLYSCYHGGYTWVWDGDKVKIGKFLDDTFR